MSIPLPAGTWTLDPAHSVVHFAIRHLGISTIHGRFGEASAELTVGEDLATSSLSAEIDMSSVDTGNADRDNHLRGTDFFSVDANPKMTFASTSIDATGDDTFRVTGDLTINGHTQEETIDVAFHGVETFPMDGSTRSGFEGSTSIDRTDYGISFNVPLESGGVMLAHEVRVLLDIQLVGS